MRLHDCECAVTFSVAKWWSQVRCGGCGRVYQLRPRVKVGREQRPKVGRK